MSPKCYFTWHNSVILFYFYAILWMLCFHNEHVIFSMIIIWKDSCFSWSIGYECMLSIIASFNVAFRIGP